MHQDIGFTPPDLPERKAILTRLNQVLDPELDTSILHLGFVTSIQAENGRLSVELRLPTYFCSPNFVFMMAADARNALLTLNGINDVTIRLCDHFASAAIESGVNSGKSFAETFPGEAWDDLEALRNVFLRKGYVKRQEALVRCLRQAGYAGKDIARLQLADLGGGGTSHGLSANHSMSHIVPPDVVQLYLQRRAELGLDCSDDAPLMLDENGAQIAPEHFDAYMIHARTVRVSLEANGSLCSAVLEARKAAQDHPQLLQIS